MNIFAVSFCGQPYNYSAIDKYVSRSAQPEKEDFVWLKEQGITDVFNFRTMYVSGLDFDEGKTVKELGMKYHSIPSITSKPNEENIFRFLKEVNEVKARGGLAHIHCFAGADRTGMYAFIYKMFNNLGNLADNKTEWLNFGHHKNKYPELMGWAEDFIKRTAKPIKF